jgi:lipopolysaccharide assembly protein A
LRFLKYLLLALIAVCCVVIAVANRGPVTLNLLPVDYQLAFPTSVTVPVFVALLLALFVGIAVGILLEMVRERRHRRAESQYKREAAKLDKEVQRLSTKAGEEDHDILGLKQG